MRSYCGKCRSQSNFSKQANDMYRCTGCGTFRHIKGGKLKDWQKTQKGLLESGEKAAAENRKRKY